MDENIVNIENIQETNCKKCVSCCEPAWKGVTRHLSFGITLLVFFAFMALDGNLEGFVIKNAWISIMETVLVTMIIALFTSRGVEKSIKIWKEHKLNKNNDNIDSPPDIYNMYK